MTRTREEVAEYLRSRANDALDHGGLLGTLKNALGIEEGTWRDVLRSLAELMEGEGDGQR